MKRLVFSTTVAAAAIVLAASPALAQLPAGKGLTDPFPVECPDLGGTVLMVEPPGYAPSHWTVDGDHLVITQLAIAGPEGTFEQTFGEKRGLDTIVCTATHETPSGVEHATVTFGILPGADR